MSGGTHFIEPATMGQYLAHGECTRYLRQAVAPAGEDSARPWREAYGVLNLALLGSGREFEASEVEELAADAALIIGPDLPDEARAGLPDIDVDEVWADDPAGRLDQYRRACDHTASLPVRDDHRPYVLLVQAPMSGQIGAFPVAGAADAVVIAPTSGDASDDPTITARVIDCKCSAKESAAHRIQVAMYADLLAETLPTAVSIEAAVLTTDESLAKGISNSPFAISTFSWQEWAVAAERRLDAAGSIAEALQTALTELRFTIDEHCLNCAYREACMTRAVEDLDGPLSLALLGLDEHVQAALAEEGIDSLVAMSEVIAFDAAPTYDAEPTIHVDPATYRRLDAILDEPVVDVALRAQALRGEIDPAAHPFRYPPQRPGAGFPPIPGDDKPGWGRIEDSRPGELIRVALVVRPDPTIDRLAGLGVSVRAIEGGDPIEFARLTEALSDDPSTAHRVERDLLRSFLDELFDAIKHTANTLDRPIEEAVIHLFTLSTHEQRVLDEALERHPDLDGARALRSLLQLTPAGTTPIDQAMTTALHPVLDRHFALPYLTRSLFSLLDRFDPEWHISDIDPPGGPSLRERFAYRFFDDRAPYQVTDEGTIRFHGQAHPPDGWYPLRPRSGTQVAIEYFWAVCPRDPSDSTPRLHPGLVEEWAVEDDHRDLYRQEIDRYRGPDDHRLTRDDLSQLLERLAHAVNRLALAVPITDHYRPKVPLDASQLRSIDLTRPTLADAARDVTAIEHQHRREEIEDHHATAIPARVTTGKSIPIRCDRLEPQPDGGLRLHGTLAYDAVFPEPAEANAAAGNIRISDGSHSGDWRVLTRLTPTGDPTDPVTEVGVGNPHHLKHSPPILIEDLDQSKGRITLTLFPRRFTAMFSRYRVDHCGWVCPHGSNLEDDGAPIGATDYPSNRRPVTVEPGDLYLLDPMVDDFTAPKVMRALEPDTLEHNTVARQLDELRRLGATRTAPQFTPAGVEAYLDRIDQAEDVLVPNADQRTVVENTTDSIVPLQGPPGSGKTSGAAAHAILARALAASQRNHSFLAVACAPAHTAVDGLLEDVVARLDEVHDAVSGLDDLTLLRVLPAVPPTADLIDGEVADVVYTDYHSDAGVDTIAAAVEPCLTAQRRLDGTTPACVIFTTPETLYGVLSVIAGMHPDITATSTPAAMRHAAGLADLVCIDEASMLDMGRFLLVGSTVKPDGQTLVIGDHRQLATISATDWDRERRAFVTDAKAQLSAIEYLAWLADQPIPDDPRRHTPPANPIRGDEL